MEPIPITPEGVIVLKEELNKLKKQMPIISKQIGEAIELGDLSENFEYHSAKNQQGLVNSKIRDIEARLSLGKVIDRRKLSGDRVVFGARVQLVDVDTDEEFHYDIVGEAMADVSKRRINFASPLARKLIGKEVGDEVTLPGKTQRTVEILEVIFDYSF